MTPVRVIVVEDHPDVRSVIAALLSIEERFAVVGEARNGEEGIDLTEREQPDVVLLDLAMPVMDGLTALPAIQMVAPDTKVIVLSGFGTDRTVHAAMKAGASAFLHKDADLSINLVRVLDKVSDGDADNNSPVG